MREVGVLEAKTHLSKLLDEMEGGGEEIVITRNGRPIANLLPHAYRELTRSRYAERIADAIADIRRLRTEAGDPAPGSLEAGCVRELLGRDPVVQPNASSDTGCEGSVGAA